MIGSPPKRGGPPRFTGRMIAMKRLPALLLSLFLLTLLSMPSQAVTKTENVSSDGTQDLPVYLAVDAADMVDVTISWNELTYTYGSNGFAAEDVTIPQITVTNNNPQNNITIDPQFVRNDEALSESMFDLYFYESKTEVPTQGTDVRNQLINGRDSFSFYAIPYGDPLGWSAASKTPAQIGSVRITIALTP